MALMGDSEIGTTSATAGAEAMAQSAVNTELVFAGFRRLSASGKRVSSLGKAGKCQGAGDTEPLCPLQADIVLQETTVEHDCGHEVPRMIAHDFGYPHGEMPQATVEISIVLQDKVTDVIPSGARDPGSCGPYREVEKNLGPSLRSG